MIKEIKAIAFDIDGYVMTSRLIEGNFIEYQRSTAMGRDANMFRGHMGGAAAQAMGTHGVTASDIIDGIKEVWNKLEN